MTVANPFPRLAVRRVHFDVGATPPDGDPIVHDLFLEQADGTSSRVNLVGFSYFGEIAGIRNTVPAGEKFVHLSHDGETGLPPTQAGDVRLTFDQWFDGFERNDINFSRAFAFDAQVPDSKWFPFAKTSAGLYDLRRIDAGYLDRLAQYVAKARARNVVVCISMFNDQSLDNDEAYKADPQQGRRASHFFVNPFNRDLNVQRFIDPNLGPPVLRRTFYDIALPPSWAAMTKEQRRADLASSSFGAWNARQQLYAVQWNMVVSIVERTCNDWNVMYELCNEPTPGAQDAGGEPLDASWLETVAEWIDGEARPTAGGPRVRPIMVNVAPPGCIAGQRARVMPRLLARGFVDVFSFHGKEWSDADFTCGQAISDLRTVAEIRARVRDLLTGAGGIRFDDYVEGGQLHPAPPVVPFFDFDAHARAQVMPANYVRAVLGLNGSFEYRWGEADLSPAGLAKRLGDVRDAARGTPRSAFGTAPRVHVDFADVAAGPELIGPAVTYQWNLARDARSATPHDRYRISYTNIITPTDPPITIPLPNGEPNPLDVAIVALKHSPSGRRTRHMYQGFRADIHVEAMATAARTPASPVLVPRPVQVTLISVSPQESPRPSRLFRSRVQVRNDGWAPWGVWRHRAPPVAYEMRTNGLYFVHWFAPGAFRGYYVPLPQPLGGVGVIADDVPRGRTATFEVEQLLPYTRRTIGVACHFMTFWVDPATLAVFGGAAEALLAPHAIDIIDPKRRVTQVVDESPTIGPGQPFERIVGGEIPPTYELLAIGSDASVPPGTVVRAGSVVAPSAPANPGSLPRRWLRVSVEGEAPVPVRIHAVRLVNADLDLENHAYAVRTIAPGAEVSATFDSGVPERFRVVVVDSDSPGARVDWSVGIEWVNGKQARVWRAVNRSSAAVNVTMRGLRLTEYRDPLPGETWEKRGEVTLGADGSARVDLTALFDPTAASARPRHLVAAVTVPGDALAGTRVVHEVVLREAGGRLRAFLEVRSSAAAAGRIATFRVLDVAVDVQPTVVEAAAEDSSALHSRILDFFNQAASPDDLVTRVGDDPGFGAPSPRAYGIRPSVARAILAARAERPDGRFTSIADLDLIPGVGRDTYRDIFFSFEHPAAPDDPLDVAGRS